MSKGDVKIAFGIMGGWNQSQAHAQTVANIVDAKMNIQAAMEAPRFSKQTFEGCDVQVEVGNSGKDERAGGARAPDKLRGNPARSGWRAGGNAEFCGGVNYGGTDPRKDGRGDSGTGETRKVMKMKNIEHTTPNTEHRNWESRDVRRTN